MDKSLIFYTDNRLDDRIALPVRKLLLATGLHIFSASLKPMDFGHNICVHGLRGYPTMVRQILAALELSTSEYVMFTEHDVLYHSSHFAFTPPRDDIFYYNLNNYRWQYPFDRAITYDHLLSLSGLCCNRLLALDHYRKRLERIEAKGWLEDNGHEAGWARRMGYEPGTKKTKWFPDENYETWRSDYPNIDIRHMGTFSRRKCKLTDFQSQPTGWKEVKLSEIPGWDLEKMFTI